MPATIHIHPSITSNPTAIADLQLRTGLAAVISPRGKAVLIDLQRLRRARQQNHDAHVRQRMLHSFNAAVTFLRQRLEQPQTGYQPDPAA